MKDPLKSNESNLSQTLILDVSKVKSPIELKVDQITDYGALTFTLIISAIISAITAFVTIYLVTKSNNQLIESQKDQNESQLIKQEEFLARQIESQENQKNKELNTHSKQIWIDKLRESATQFLYNTSRVIIQALSTVNAYNTYKQDQNTYAEVNKNFDEINTIVRNLEIAAISIDLSLEGNNPIDDEIKKLLTEIINHIKVLNSTVLDNFTEKRNFQLIDYSTLKTLPEVDKIYELEIKLKKKFIELFKEKRNFLNE